MNTAYPKQRPSTLTLLLCLKPTRTYHTCSSFLNRPHHLLRPARQRLLYNLRLQRHLQSTLLQSRQLQLRLGDIPGRLAEQHGIVDKADPEIADCPIAFGFGGVLLGQGAAAAGAVVWGVDGVDEGVWGCHAEIVV